MPLIYLFLPVFYLPFMAFASNPAMDNGSVLDRANFPIDSNQNTVLHKIIEHGGSNKNGSLEHIPKETLNTPNKEGLTPFLLGLMANSDFETIEWMLKENPEVIYARTNDKRTALLIALQYQNPLKVIQLIYNTNPTALFIPDSHGNLPQHYAIKYKQNTHNSTRVMNFILQLYPSASFTPNNRGETPFMLGLTKNATPFETIKFMRTKNSETAYTQQSTYNGMTALHIALKHQKPLKMIIFTYDTDPSAIRTPDNHGNLPLHYAFRYRNSTEVIRFIAKLNPEALFVRNQFEKTPLNIAEKYMNKFDTSKLLLLLERKQNGHSNTLRASSSLCQTAFTFH